MKVTLTSRRALIPSVHSGIAVAALLALVYTSNLSAQTPAQTKRDLARKIRIEESAQAMVNMPSIAPLFLQNAQFSSTLYVVNEGNVPVTGRLLLLVPAGDLILDMPITVPGHDKSVIPISSLLQSAHSSATQGSIELFDDNVEGSALVGGVVVNYRSEKTAVNIDEELLMPAMSASHQLRGLAIEASGSPIVSIGSTSDQPAQITVSCIGEHSKTAQMSK
jgi:hypothetical protein